MSLCEFLLFFVENDCSVLIKRLFELFFQFYYVLNEKNIILEKFFVVFKYIVLFFVDLMDLVNVVIVDDLFCVFGVLEVDFICGECNFFVSFLNSINNVI